MLLELVSKDELGRVLGIDAGAGPLPVSARSRTPGEVRRRAARAINWMIGAFVLILIAYGATLLLAETQPTRVAWMPVVFGVGAAVIAFAAVRKLRPVWGYRDPGLTVDVSDDGVTVSGPDGSDSRAYDAVSIARIVTRTPRNSVYFEGIVLETDFGPVLLGDAIFAGGNAAAGAILRKLDELELPLKHAA